MDNFWLNIANIINFSLMSAAKIVFSEWANTIVLRLNLLDVQFQEKKQLKL